ncbi:hypothetical protein [Phenylobacterium montanum]|uniref:hypothetical protein n=1 Tax=Phenylobacterium montanum TaxID=2823693 RepID=UPI003460EC9A
MEACDVASAPDVLKDKSGICLIFTDMNMLAKLDGADLVRFLQRHYQNTRVILMSGNIKKSCSAEMPFLK